MSHTPCIPLVAIDVGNSRIKLGFFQRLVDAGLSQPDETLDLVNAHWTADQLASWSDSLPQSPQLWSIASVHSAESQKIVEAIESLCTGQVRQLTHLDVPLEVNVEHPEQVGIDRLLGAVAANRLRAENRPAVVIDLGSAITVDLISAEGIFQGGAILPGIGMSARALREQTDKLPHLPISQLETPPQAIGRQTAAAIESGLFWGAVGAVKELLAQFSKTLSAEPEIFLTGGAAPAVAGLIAPQARYVSSLILAGIALASCGARE